MHNDQKRIKSSFFPFLMDRVMSDDPVAVQDCTVLNRAVLQGPDPLLLTLLCPWQFTTLCRSLGLTDVQGREAIEMAHVQGPGVLLGDGKGIPADLMDRWCKGQEGTFLPWRKEALWLVLAGLSDTTEEGYEEDISLLERLRRVTKATSAFTETMINPQCNPWVDAIAALKKFEASCVWTMDAAGIPITDQDHGFWCGYRAGHVCVGVTHGDKTFYGTIPGTTLDACGIKVDEKVSESYGFVRNPVRFR